MPKIQNIWQILEFQYYFYKLFSKISFFFQNSEKPPLYSILPATRHPKILPAWKVEKPPFGGQPAKSGHTDDWMNRKYLEMRQIKNWIFRQFLRSIFRQFFRQFLLSLFPKYVR